MNFPERFLASIPLYLQVTEMGPLRSTTLNQLYLYPNYVATVGNILERYRRHIFLDVFIIMKSSTFD
jgi:hypothetical protein